MYLGCPSYLSNIYLCLSPVWKNQMDTSTTIHVIATLPQRVYIMNTRKKTVPTFLNQLRVLHLQIQTFKFNMNLIVLRIPIFYNKTITCTYITGTQQPQCILETHGKNKPENRRYEEGAYGVRIDSKHGHQCQGSKHGCPNQPRELRVEFWNKQKSPSETHILVVAFRVTANQFEFARYI